MKAARFVGREWLWVLGLCLPAATSAQESAGMGEGEANINVRSDVRLGIKGTRSTTTERLEQLTEVVTGEMPALRKCYRDLMATEPTTVGSLAIRITLGEGKGKAAFELKETGGTAPKLTKCIAKVLERASFKKVGRPAAAVATLEFDNTRAKGQEEMAQRMQTTDKIDVREGQGGGHQATWSSNDGKVAFTVASKTSAEAVEVATRTFRDSYAAFADCRRRSEKDGLSPAGEFQVQVQLQRGGESNAKITQSTVAHKRAVPCVERALKRIEFKAAPPGQRIDVTIRFSP